MSNNTCIVVKFKTRWVDLGLPSGTKWARINIGATNPEDDGYYFSWGNVEEHSAGDGYGFNTTNYNASSGAALVGDIPVNTTYDAAMANFGENAKMPTKDQFKELIENCTSEWTTLNGVNGRRFTSIINGNSIFLPASGLILDTTVVNKGSAGNYWQSTYYSQDKGCRLSFGSSGAYYYDNLDRFYGLPIRPVMQNNN